MGTLREAYEVLGVTPAASAGEVADAYRSLVQIYHPDRYVDSPERVRVEAERRMQDLNEAYRLIRRPTTATPEPAPRPKPKPAPAARPAPTEPAVGRPAEPLEPPTLPYSKGQWDAATRKWTWSDDAHTWRCGHGKDMCATCGATPDAVALKAGTPRPPYTWRRSMKGDWVCSAHHKPECEACGSAPRDGAPVVNLASKGRKPEGTPVLRIRRDRRWG